MTLFQLIFALVATGVLIYIATKVPHPWPWVLYGIIAICWVLGLIYFLGISGNTVI